MSKSTLIGPFQNICICPNELSFVTKAIWFGVQNGNKLSRSSHVKSLSKRFSARVKKLKHLKDPDKHILESIYFKGIVPSVTQSIALWGSSKSIQLLDDIHNRAGRLIFNIKESTLDTDVLTATKWSLIVFLYKKITACIIYQAFYNRALAGDNSLFNKYSLSKYHRDKLMRPKSDLLRSSFSHRASILWNNLPTFLKSKPNLESFKCALKAKSDSLDKISFNGTQGTNKDTASNSDWTCWFSLILFTVI